MSLPPLIPWARTFLPNHFYDDSPPFHWVFAEKLDGKSKRKAYVIPRGFSKSTILCLAFVLRRCAYQKNRYIVIFSETRDQAAQLLEDLKAEFEENELLLATYPHLAPGKPWRNDEIALACGIRIRALGIGQRIRGRKRGGSRPDLIIMDDAEDDKAVKSLERRTHLRKWLFAAVLPALAPEGEFIMVGTILHRDSLLARAIRIEGWDSRMWRALTDDGHSLWEKRHPVADLQRKKAEYESVGLLDLFYQEYQGISKSPEGAPFQPSDFTYFLNLPTDQDGNLLRFWKSLFIDPAISEENKADFTGYTVVYASYNGFWYVVEAFRRKEDPSKTIENILRLHQKHQLDVIGIESVAYQKALAYWLRERGLELGEALPIETVGTKSIDKRTRILGLQPYFRSNRIKFRASIPERLRNELEFLDEIDHDDLADSLSGHLGITLRPEPPRMRIKKYHDAMTERAAKHAAELERISRLKRRNIDLGWVPK